MFCWELFCTNHLRSPILLISRVVLATNRQRSQLGMSDLAQQILGPLLQLGARQSRTWAWRQLSSGWQEHWGSQMLFLTAVCYPPNSNAITSCSLCLFGISTSFLLSGLKCNRDRVVLLDLWCRGSFRYTGKHQLKRGDGRFKLSKRKHFLGNMYFKLWYSLPSGHCGAKKPMWIWGGIGHSQGTKISLGKILCNRSLGAGEILWRRVAMCLSCCIAVSWISVIRHWIEGWLDLWSGQLLHSCAVRPPDCHLSSDQNSVMSPFLPCFCRLPLGLFQTSSST